MDWFNPTIVTAFVGLLAGFLAFLKVYLEVRPLLPTTAGRAAALPGTWRGSIQQPDHPKGFREASVTMTLQTRGRRVTGKASISAVSNEKPQEQAQRIVIALQLKGGFQRESILRIDYANVDGSVLQFGTFYLQLDASGRRLVGRFAGYGHLAEGIVYGHFQSEKEGP